MNPVNNLTKIQDNLIEISNIVHSAEKDTDESKLNLARLRSTTLSTINSELISLPSSSQSYLQKIKNIINDSKWSEIPTPERIKLDIAEIKNLIDNINETISFLAIDINAIMALLLEYMRKGALTQKDISIEQRNFQVKSIDLEASEKKKAADAQYTAELISNVTQAVLSTAQLVGGVAALGRSVSSLAKSSKALDITKENNVFAVDLQKQRAELKTINSNISKHSQNANPQAVGELKSKRAEAVGNLNEIKLSISNNKLEINSLNSEIASANKVTESTLGVVNSSASAIKSLVEASLTRMKFDTKLTEINAEAFAANRNLINSSEQSSQNSYQQFMESLKSLIQMLTAIQTALNSMMLGIRA